ncbi:histone-fold-containing protein [Colletotrichum somersetense]|nr:histone-fold-containing protein [Colletotrichum somersetense]
MSSPPTYANRGSGYRPSVGGAKRHRMIFKDNVRRISKSDIRRLARRGGVKRICQGIYYEIRAAIKRFLEDVIRGAVIYCDYAKRRTVTSLDVVHAMRLDKRILYGYGC